MPYARLAVIKHRLTLTGEDLALIRDRLIPIAPSDYDLGSFSTLRHLYGRFDSIVLRDEITLDRKKGG